VNQVPKLDSRPRVLWRCVGTRGHTTEWLAEKNLLSQRPNKFKLFKLFRFFKLFEFLDRVSTFIPHKTEASIGPVGAES
jgi:hypothetical protein